MATETPSRLVSHFSSAPSSSQASRWEPLWADNFSPWDRGRPSPALFQALRGETSLSHLTTNTSATSKPRRALVPGCGTGYDVQLLASFGFDVVGLEVSSTAVGKARMLSANIQSGEETRFPVHSSKRGNVEIVEGDFFADGWIEKVAGSGGFDLIYDYTFLCALSLEMRPQWAARMSDLLASEGRLVCLEFPRTKPTNEPGPPWPLPSEVYPQLLVRPGEPVEYDTDGKVAEKSVKASEKALERIAHWEPSESFGTSFGPDMMSVWKHV